MTKVIFGNNSSDIASRYEREGEGPNAKKVKKEP